MASDNRFDYIVISLSGLTTLWQSIHDQVDAKELSSTELWDIKQLN